MGLGAATMATSGFGAPAAESAYAAARSLSQRIGDAPRLFPALWGQWLFYWGRGTLSTANELAAELRERATGAGDDVRLQALHASWATSFSLGHFAQATAEAKDGSGLYDRGRHAAMAATYGSHDAGVCARIFAARALAFVGRVDEALRSADDGIALARSLDHVFSMALSLAFRAAVAQSSGDPASAAAYAAEGRALAEEQGFALQGAWCTAIGGWAAARLGEPGGVDDVERGISLARMSGSDQFVPFLLGLFAEGCLVTRRTDAGIAATDEALALTRRTGERFYESELHRLRGELLLAAGRDRADAGRAFRSALAVAQDQGAALLELRAAIRLARLSADGDGDGAYREILRTARGALPAGQTVPDLAEADALLEGDGIGRCRSPSRGRAGGKP
jgi:predicted ATPase